MDPSRLIEQLSSHRTLSGVPSEQLAWLARTGVERTLEPGEVLTPRTGPVRGLYIVLDGHLLIRVDGGAGPRIVMEWHAGDVTGILPYSRIKGPPGDVVAEERTTILAIATEELPRLIRECPDLTAVLVHVMVDRARVFKSSELLDEKMASLGRLAAGLAHELNNPASAVARSAKTLVTSLTTLEESTRRFCTLNLSAEQSAAVVSLRDNRPAAPRAPLSPIERSEREDAMADSLADRKIDGVDAAPFVDSGFLSADLEKLDALFDYDKLGAVMAHLSAALIVQQLANEIGTAATRIHSLVSAVKGFTYVDQQTTFQPIAIGRGLADTITVLGSKARSHSVAVDLHIPENLPAVEGYGGELNQVWANLIDNAIDATPKGHVRIEAEADGDSVVVRVIDDGPGIPAAIANRIFDPFFTTKEIGQGTGLGLDIARRIVLRHRGAIDVHTVPGRTEFSVRLPAQTRTTPAGGPPAGARS